MLGSLSVLSTEGKRIRGAVRKGLAAATLSAAALLFATAPASARLTTIEGANAPGPDTYDKVFVSKFGPKKAKRVLVLVPGTLGGAGDFSLLARELVDRVPHLQVWAVDRREQVFEDTSGFAQALEGQISPGDAFNYYLGWLTNSSIERHFQPLDEDTVPFTREWGLKVELNDVRKVVRKASRHGRKVVLGGHSLGASSALAYASWDFHGRPGFRDVEAIVLIDGGLLGSFDAFNLQQAQQAIKGLSTDSPFLNVLGIPGFPWAAGVFAEVGGTYAKLDPTAASPVQNFPLLPSELRPPFPVTNRALLGFDLDESTSPLEADLHVRAGQLAASGSPRDWQDGEVSPIARVADTFGQEPANAVEWYFPYRLTIDVNGADRLRRNDVANFLGLRPWHTKKVNVPLYSFQTSLTNGDVLRGAKEFVKRSKVRRNEAELVDGTATTSHLDPLTAAPKTNDFLKTVVPFLEDAYR
jgi:pimeloyl-ACP methyl ester carboxylesterase